MTERKPQVVLLTRETPRPLAADRWAGERSEWPVRSGWRVRLRRTSRVRADPSDHAGVGLVRGIAVSPLTCLMISTIRPSVSSRSASVFPSGATRRVVTPASW